MEQLQLLRTTTVDNTYQIVVVILGYTRRKYELCCGNVIDAAVTTST